MGPRDRLRAADADREAVAERLRGAVAEGRLDLREYDERLGQTYAAKTYGDLYEVLADLPGPVPAPAVPAPVAQPVYPHAGREWLAERWRPWASVVAICVAIWAAVALLSSGGVPYFWPAWVAIPWGAVLLCRTVGGLATGEPRRWAAARAIRPSGSARSG